MSHAPTSVIFVAAENSPKTIYYTLLLTADLSGEEPSRKTTWLLVDNKLDMSQ